MTQAANLGALGTNAGTTGILPAAGGGTAGTNGAIGFKNRIINGNMVLDQRNAGASVSLPDGSLATTYVMDRWAGYRVGTTTATLQQVTDVPTGSGFTNSFVFTNGTGVTPGATASAGVYQRIEGYNITDFSWGTASAKNVTLSFWAKSSLTGTFTVALVNAAYTRSYPATYTISAANTWQYISINITGCTDGAWNTTNGNGVAVNFDMGSGSTYTATANTWSNNYYTGATGAVKLCQTTGATFYATSMDVLQFSQLGQYSYRMRWYQGGASRNRVYKLVAVSAAPIVVLGGVMDVRRSSGGAN
jgi:hypothetical protein